jgi:hypothetical protein
VPSRQRWSTEHNTHHFYPLRPIHIHILSVDRTIGIKPFCTFVLSDKVYHANMWSVVITAAVGTWNTSRWGAGGQRRGTCNQTRSRQSDGLGGRGDVDPQRGPLQYMSANVSGNFISVDRLRVPKAWRRVGPTTPSTAPFTQPTLYTVNKNINYSHI